MAREQTAQETIRDRLTTDHRAAGQALQELAARCEEKGIAAPKDPVLLETMRHLLAHMRAEEAVLFPHLERRMWREIAGAKMAHATFRESLSGLTSPGVMPVEGWILHLNELRRELARHNGVEETIILPAIEIGSGPSQLDTLGATFRWMER